MKDDLTILKENGNFYIGYNITDETTLKVERGTDAKFEENCRADKVYLSFEWIERIYNEMKLLKEKEMDNNGN